MVGIHLLMGTGGAKFFLFFNKMKRDEDLETKKHLKIRISRKKSL